MKKLASELKQLVETPAVSGYEWELGITQTIQRLMGFDGQKIGGNLNYSFGNGKKKILFSAHMDEIGFMVTGGNSKKARFVAVGDVSDKSFDNQQVEIFDINTDTSQGTISRGIINIASDNRPSPSVGSVGTFKKSFQMNKSIVNASSLDNKVGCLALIYLGRFLKNNTPKYTITLCFSTQEEVGLNGLMRTVRVNRPDLCIDVDSAYTNKNKTPKSWSVPTIDKGPALQLMGTDYMCQSTRRRFIERISQSKSIPLQYEIPSSYAGGTNAKSLTNAGYETIQLNIPVARQHTAQSEASMNDIKNMITLLKEVTKAL